MNPITIRDNEINERVLREARTLLIKPPKRVVTLGVLAVYVCASALSVWTGLWGFVPVFTALLLYFLAGQPYLRQGKVIRSMTEIMRRTYGRPACAFDVTFEEACVRSVNVKTRETVRIPYGDFVKMVRGKTTIAIVSRKGHLVAIDRAKAGEQTCDAVLEIIRQRCTNVQFR